MPRHIKIICYLSRISILFISVSLFSIFLKANDIKKSSKLNVLLVTLDTTRADRVGCYGYKKAKTPNLDALASGGIRFSNAYSPVPLTLPSHCSILTGTYPIYHHVHNNGFYYLSQDHISLAEILKERGFKTAAFVSSFTVDSRFGIDQGFDFYDDKFREEEILKNFRSERKADEVYASFSSWLDKYHNRKFFCWVHFFDPHLPYNPPPPFRQEFSGRPYDGEIAYMDYYLGRTVDKLKEKNILDNTLIILAGDHGEALGERREIDHGLFIYDNSLKVPLIFYSQNHLPRGLVINTRIRLIDIMPTILDMLKISINKEIQGKSLLPLIKGRKKDDFPSYIESYYPRENFGWSSLTGLIDADWKYIQAPKPELFNLKTDPQEEKNVIHEEKKIARNMIGKLKDMIKNFSSEKGARGKKLSLEEERRLKSLGYIGGEPSKDASKKPLPDPKDKIEEYILYFRGNLHETRGEYQKAVDCYKEVLRLNPDVANNYVNLGFLYAKMNKIDEAIKLLEQGRNRIPGSLIILSRLINFYLKAERFEKALSMSQVVLKIDPQYFDVLFLSGSIKAKMGNWEQALSYYRKALEIEPENKTLKMRYAYTLAALGRNEEALKEYRRLKKEYPGDYKIYRDLSLVYESMGNLKMALQNLKRAVELNPGPETYYAYAFLLEKVGDLKEAIHWLKLYLQTTAEKNTPRKNKAKKALAQWEKRL